MLRCGGVAVRLLRSQKVVRYQSTRAKMMMRMRPPIQTAKKNNKKHSRMSDASVARK